MIIECESDFFILFLNQLPHLNITLVVCKAGLGRDLGGASQNTLA